MLKRRSIRWSASCLPPTLISWTLNAQDASKCLFLLFAPQAFPPPSQKKNLIKSKKFNIPFSLFDHIQFDCLSKSTNSYASLSKKKLFPDIARPFFHMLAPLFCAEAAAQFFAIRLVERHVSLRDALSARRPIKSENPT